MKKLIAMLLALVMVFGLVACGSKTPAEMPKDPAPAETTPVQDDAKEPAKTEDDPAADGVTIAMLPKFKGENYFDACKTGAEAAAEALGVTLLYDGPSQDQATNQMQVDILEGWINQGVDAIAVSPNDATAIAATLKKAADAGIKVITFDADSELDARSYHCQQVAADGAAKGLLDAAKQDLEAKGYGPDNTANIALVGSSGTDANQNAWIAAIKELLATEEYSWMLIKNEATDIIHPGTDETKVNEACATLIGRMGEGEDKIQGAIALSSMAAPALGAQYEAAAVKPDASKVTLTGLATPNGLKDYIKDETNPLNTGVLWSCFDLGYMAISVADMMVKGELAEGATSVTYMQEGTEMTKEISEEGYICLGDALVFDAATVDNYNY